MWYFWCAFTVFQQAVEVDPVEGGCFCLVVHSCLGFPCVSLRLHDEPDRELKGAKAK